ncbi:MAG: lysophospholipase [Firmicutes bacterium]|nr:lysophospholipase [Bacillota bacterium]
MYKREVYTIQAYDKMPIRVARLQPEEGTPKGVVQMIHGFGEGIELYYELAKCFVDDGFVAVVQDLRGFGKMEHLTVSKRRKARGVVKRYTDLLRDVEAVRESVEKIFPSLPMYLYGHSMGGNIAINHLLTQDNAQQKYQKLILEAPWLRLHKPPSRFTVFCAGVLGGLNHKWAKHTKLNRAHITRNREALHGIGSSEIFHDRIALRLFCQIAKAGEFAIKNADKVTVPTLLMAAGDDKIVSTPAILAYADKAGDNTRLIVYDHAFHSLHTDNEKAVVQQDMLAFLNEASTSD